MFHGKEKAWIGALMAFVSSLLLQRMGIGSGPSSSDMAALVNIGSEVGASLVTAALSWASVYLTANSPKPTIPLAGPNRQ